MDAKMQRWSEQMERIKKVETCDHYGIKNEVNAKCPKCGVGLSYILKKDDKWRKLKKHQRN